MNQVLNTLMHILLANVFAMAYAGLLIKIGHLSAEDPVAVNLQMVYGIIGYLFVFINARTYGAKD
jgi:hypothetical protein